MEESRLATGVPGLDEVLDGGPFAASTLLVLGAAGTGKTVLGGQIAAHHVAHGGRAVFITLLAESTERLVRHLSTLRFFDPETVSRELYAVSGHLELERGGYDAALALIRRTVRVHQASLLVVDGLSLAQQLGGRDGAFARFFYDLAALASLSGCTCVLLASQTPGEPATFIETTLADLVIELRDDRVDLRSVRSLRIVKFRGSDHLRGAHTFEIGESGIDVYPRLDTWVTHEAPESPGEEQRQAFGIPHLDEVLHGGLPSGSTTALLGAPGSGKTLLGLSFLANGASAGEPGVYYGLQESPARLIDKADALGLDFSRLRREGMLEVVWRLPVELLLDAVAREVLEVVERTGARRLFLDGVDGLRRGAPRPERASSFLTTLSLELRARGVACMFSEDLGVFQSEIRLAEHGTSTVAENILLLRYVELGARLRRLLSVLKVRQGDFDSSLREFTITDRGIDVGERFEGAEQLMSGLPTKPADDGQAGRERNGEAQPR